MVRFPILFFYFDETFNCKLNIHGHTHSKNSSFKNSINVSVEHLNLKPILLVDLLKKSN